MSGELPALLRGVGEWAWQVLVALIGTLLLALATGARPNSYDWAMMTHVASGLLPADAEFYRILARRRAAE